MGKHTLCVHIRQILGRENNYYPASNEMFDNINASIRGFITYLKEGISKNETINPQIMNLYEIQYTLPIAPSCQWSIKI